MTRDLSSNILNRCSGPIPAGTWIWLSACVLLSAGGCASEPLDDDLPASPTPLASEDTEGPIIGIIPIADGQPLDTAVVVRVTLEDESGISSALLFYRAPGTDFWGSAFFIFEDDIEYTATIPASFVQSDGVDYYVEATDNSDLRNSSFSPEAGPGRPWHFDAQLIAASFPYRATFEPTVPEADWTLANTGWIGVVAGFDDNENWTLTGASASAGQYCAYHDHGSPYQTSEFMDYLISPPIDLSSATKIDLYWWELTDYGQYAQHQLLVSIGHPDPAQGDYVPIRDPLPVTPEAEGQWAKSSHIDLSDFAGQQQVYIAFSYEGMWGDDWYLDDITLESPEPDLTFGEPEADPPVAIPGQTVQVFVDLTNVGLVSGGPLAIEFTSEDGLISISPSSISLDPIASGTSSRVGPVDILLDETHPDDTYIPMEIRALEGSKEWRGSFTIQVGQPPVAHIEITHTFEDDLQVFLGYGDVADPAFLVVVQQDEGGDASGTFSWDVDISNQRDALPPDTDAHRWFLQVWDDSIGNTGSVTSFQIQIGETTYNANGLPQAIPDDSESLFVYLPARASLEIAEMSTDPEMVAPGDRVELNVTIYNLAGPPQGDVTGRLTASTPGTQVLEPGPLPFLYLPNADPDSEVHGVLTHSAPFVFYVDIDHVDSTAVSFDLFLTDGTDDWTMPLVVPVPYPVLGGLGISFEEPVEDSSGVPGALDPDEENGLRLRIRNGGEHSTFGEVTAWVEVSSTGVEVTIDKDPIPLVPDDTGDQQDQDSGLAPREGAKSELIPIQVSGGSAGDRIVLHVTVSDGVTTISEDREVYLSEVPWNPLTVVTDPADDSDDYPIDLAEGLFRIQGSSLELRWVSHNTFDIRETYLYSFVSKARAYLYALVYVYGEIRLYQWYSGEDSGYWYRRYSSPESLAAHQIDETSLELSIDLADIGLQSSELFGGASAGACGGALACDYAPNSASTEEGLTRFWW